MSMYPAERYALFIDGANLHAAARALSFDIDYKKLLKHFTSSGHLIRTLYYTAIWEDDDYSPLRPLIDWLDYNGYTMITKPAKSFTDASGNRRIKGNMDIEIAVDVLELSPYLDHIILFSGDGDFRALIEAVQRQGKRVTVVSTLKSNPPMIADELRRQADVFIDLASVKKKIGQAHSDPADHPVPQIVEPFEYDEDDSVEL